MRHFIDPQGGYLVADVHPGDGYKEVPARPDPGHVWDGAAWVPDPLAYRAERAAAYPPVGDQLDAILKYMATQAIPADAPLAGIIAAWQAVKDAHPKPAE